MSMRLIIVGDIHGGYKALEQVLERSGYTTKEDYLVFLGDYGDGWSETFEVVEKVIELKENDAAQCLMGNHDEWILRALTNQMHLPEKQNWLHFGGQATKESYSGRTLKQLEKHIEFYKSLEPYIEFPLPWDFISDRDKFKTILFMHGGYDISKGFDWVKENAPENFYWDRSLYERAEMLYHLEQNKGSSPSEDKMSFDNRYRIFVGHTPTSKDYPIKMGNLVNLDQGAAFKGKLTAWIFQMNKDPNKIKESYVQSDPVYKLYPNEKGRNK